MPVAASQILLCLQYMRCSILWPLDLRVHLEEQLNSLRVPRIISEEAYSRANGLISEIDQIIRARALVTASGGFQANLDWLEEAWGPAARNFTVRGTEYAQGGILRTLLDQGMERVAEADQCHAIALDARAPKFDAGIVSRVDSVPFSIMVNKRSLPNVIGHAPRAVSPHLRLVLGLSEGASTIGGDAVSLLHLDPDGTRGRRRLRAR